MKIEFIHFLSVFIRVHLWFQFRFPATFARRRAMFSFAQITAFDF